MGGGSWTEEAFRGYSTSMNRGFCSDGTVLLCNDVKQNYTQNRLADVLNPLNVMRECRDSAEHPNTIPVILALDVTGSMGDTANEVAAKLGVIMTELYKEVTDVEFMIMGIGDFVYDRAPLQVSQFESDVRIAEQLDKIYFEGGGGPNAYESYSAAWAFAATQTDLDCWNRGKRGIIITMGDEQLNPYLPRNEYENATGQKGCFQTNDKDIDTDAVYAVASQKYDIYHINIEHGRIPDMNGWNRALGKDHVYSCHVDSLAQVIAQIIAQHNEDAIPVETADTSVIGFTNEISW